MRLGQQASSCSSCCKGCDVRLPLARFTFRSILIRAVLLASAWHVRSFPSPHDPASAICAWLQSARGGRYTRSVHACEHACDNLRAAAVISLTCHMSHLTYVPLTFLWFHPWPTTAPRLPVSASSSNP